MAGLAVASTGVALLGCEDILLVIVVVAVAAHEPLSTLDAVSFPRRLRYHDQKGFVEPISCVAATYLEHVVVLEANPAPTPPPTPPAIITQINMMIPQKIPVERPSIFRLSSFGVFSPI